MRYDTWKTTPPEMPEADEPWEYDPKTDQVHCIGCGCPGDEPHEPGCQFDVEGHPI